MLIRGKDKNVFDVNVCIKLFEPNRNISMITMTGFHRDTVVARRSCTWHIVPLEYLNRTTIQKLSKLHLYTLIVVGNAKYVLIYSFGERKKYTSCYTRSHAPKQ